jgi:cytochrome c-type biogenesis protein CcmH/NrfF
MRLREPLAGLFLVVLATAPPAAQERLSSPEFHEASEALICQCGCYSTVSNCAMEHCHSAEPIREEIASRLENGESVESIVSVFKERYGLAILSAPPATGFHLTAWITPFVVLAIGFFVTRHVLRSWKRETAAAEPAPVSMSDAQRKRIEKELRELSS